MIETKKASSGTASVSRARRPLRLSAGTLPRHSRQPVDEQRQAGDDADDHG